MPNKSKPSAVEPSPSTSNANGASGSVTAPLRLCTIVSEEGEKLTPFVQCPRQSKSINAHSCVGCARLEALEWEPNVGGKISCVKDATIPMPRPLDRRADLAEEVARIQLHEVVRPITTCITADLTIPFVKHLIKERGLRSLPVVDADGRLQGLISRTDIMRAPDFGSVADMMPPSVHALPDNAPLGYAIALMAFEDLSEVPVVTEDGRVIGVYYALDAMRWIANRIGYVTPEEVREAEAPGAEALGEKSREAAEGVGSSVDVG